MLNENPDSELQNQTTGDCMDSGLEKLMVIFLCVLLFILLIVPSDWLMAWSLWWNNIH